MKNYKVFFLAKKNSGAFSFQCEVQADNENAAKIKARSELLAEGFNPTHFNEPVVTVVRSMQGAA